MLRLSCFALFVAGCLGSTGCDADPNAASASKGKKILICPECRLEYAYSDLLVGKPCPQCGPKGKKLEAAIFGETPTPVWQKAIAIGLVAIVVVQGSILFWLSRRGRKRKQAARAADPVLHCRCPYCKRKYKYHAHSSGQGVVCRQCKTAFVFPGLEPTGAES